MSDSHHDRRQPSRKLTSAVLLVLAQGGKGSLAYELAVSLKRNDSLTSLDIRNVEAANTDDILASIGSYLLQGDCMCRLGFLSCDAFQVRHPMRANESE